MVAVVGGGTLEAGDSTLEVEVAGSTPEGEVGDSALGGSTVEDDGTLLVPEKLVRSLKDLFPYSFLLIVNSNWKKEWSKLEINNKAMYY